jgi:DUF1365 family protein
MSSHLYECRIMHERFSPKRHRFVHPIFVFSLDLDELPALHDRLKLFSVESRNLYSFRDSDFLPVGPAHCGSLRERLFGWMRSRDFDTNSIARIQLVALPRVAGYLFNPVSFYFCLADDGRPLAAIAEVTNTFREVKPFLLGPDTFAQGRFRLRVAKDFYVSPYSDVDVAFDFDLRLPDSRLAIKIDAYDAGRRTLTSTMTGIARPLTDGTLAKLTLVYPLVTMRTMALIHWHAFVLWLRRTPWFPKAARADRQRGLFRPHRSLGHTHSASSSSTG